jgi:hypothetical protein
MFFFVELCIQVAISSIFFRYTKNNAVVAFVVVLLFINIPTFYCLLCSRFLHNNVHVMDEIYAIFSFILIEKYYLCFERKRPICMRELLFELFICLHTLTYVKDDWIGHNIILFFTVISIVKHLLVVFFSLIPRLWVYVWFLIFYFEYFGFIGCCLSILYKGIEPDWLVVMVLCSSTILFEKFDIGVGNIEYRKTLSFTGFEQYFYDSTYENLFNCLLQLPSNIFWVFGPKDITNDS